MEFLLFEIAVQQVRGSHSLPRLLHTVWTQQDLCAAAASRVWHQGAQGHQGHLSDVWDQGVAEPDPVSTTISLTQDLYAKCEGSLNVQSVVKAFVLGLLRQRTHQALADEKQLHLVTNTCSFFLIICPVRMNLKVEMRKENDYYPRVVASPSDGKVV